MKSSVYQPPLDFKVLSESDLENYAALLRETDREDKAEEMEARAKAIRAKHAQENPVK